MPRIRSVFAAVPLAAFVALGFSPVPGRADPVVHLAWDDCGSAGLVTRTFACNTNVGVEPLVLSFVPPAGITAFSAVEAILQVVWTGWGNVPLPAWWELRTGCRAGSLSGPVSFPETCANPWLDGGAGGVSMSSSTPGRIMAVTALPAGHELPLDPAVEYYSMRFVFNHARSTGDGACDACSAPVGIYVSSLRLNQRPSGVNDYTYALPVGPSGMTAYVNWQCEGHPVLSLDHGGRPEFSGLWDFGKCPTATHSPTWGRIKALYR